MSHYRPVVRRRPLVVASALCLAAARLLSAQDAPPPSNPIPLDADEPIVMSPFVVDATEDKGSYQATATLAGTRLRTELKDVGSAVSVVTSQFLQDTGAKSNQDLLVYTAGTEVGGVRGNFAGTGNGRQLNESDKLLAPNANTRVRGLAAADNTRDFFLTDVPWDGYNVGRVDIQRGPNSILFGMGSPAGIINSSTDQAGFKNEGKVEARFDNEGSVRGHLNVNQVLLKNELALRFAALDDHTKYRQKPAFNRDERVYGALRYDPAFLKKNGMTTSLRVNFEHGSIHANRPRNLTPADQITPWFDPNGLNRQVYDPIAAWDAKDTSAGGGVATSASAAYNPLIGAYGNVYGNVLSVFNAGSATQSEFRTIESNENVWGLSRTDGGVPTDAVTGTINGVPFARQLGVASYSTYMTNRGAQYASLNAYKDKTLSDAGVFDFYNTLLDGDNKREWQGFETFNAALSQTFLDNRLGVEGVYDHQRYHDGQVNGVSQTIYVDPNTHYTDGSVNPHVGQAFVQSDNGGSEHNTERTAKRATAFADVRSSDFFGRNLFTRLFGNHTFTGMYADEEKKATSLSFQRWAMDDAYADDVYHGKGYKIDSNERAVTVISYLSGDLQGLGQAADAHLGGVAARQVPQSTGSIYRFDSHWNSSVNPSDPWTPGAHQSGDYQADNPANYRGWGTYAVNPFWSYDGGDKEKLYNYGNKAYYRVKSQAWVWQGHMLDNLLVPTVGWRRDEVDSGNSTADETDSGQVKFAGWDYQKKQYKTSGESISYSVVAHTPVFIKEKLPLGADLSLFYNRSSNFNPKPGNVDMFGNALPDPTGKTKDYGFVVSVFDEKLSLKVNWYQSNVTNDRLAGFEFWRVSQWASILTRNAHAIQSRDPSLSTLWDATKGTATQAQFDAGSAAVYSAYADNAVFRSFIDTWGYADNLQTDQGYGADTPAGISATADTISKGVEFELTARPTKNWNVSVNASKTHATQTNIGGSLKEWIEAVEGLAKGPAGDMRVWWAGDSTTMRTFWDQNVGSQYALLKLLEGSDVPELRPWRFTAVTGYNFDRGVLKGVNVGGAYRWEDSQVIGFPIKSQVNATTGDTEYVYDVSKPYRGKTENHVDFWIGYGRKLTRKIDWRIQLNIRDVFAKKDLIPVSVEPDGTPAAYRIPELTSWQVTNTFTF